MKFELRTYQKATSDKAVAFFLNNDIKHNGLIVIPTGGGKSWCIADIANRLNSDVLVFCPSREIVIQNHEKMQKICPNDCAIYSASIGKKQIAKITFATIGSAINHEELFSHFKYIIIDEAHLCNPKGGMYKKFLSHLKCKVIGFTATCYRLESSCHIDRITKKPKLETAKSWLQMLTDYKKPIFSEIIYNIQIDELLKQGYLAKVRYLDAKPKGWEQMKLFKNTSGADFTDKSVKHAYYSTRFSAHLADVVSRLLNNTKTGIKRNGILVFTRFVDEAMELALQIDGCAVVSGDTPKNEREEILRRFKDGEIKVVANAACLTTGFDFPALDTVVMARPTMSLSLYYQICIDMNTEILTKRGFLKYEEITINDMAASFENGKIIWSKIEDIVHRNMFEGERFISFKNQHLDFKVTENHELLVKCKGSISSFIKEQAIDVLKRKHTFIVPVSGIMESKGVDIPDCGIKFVGYAISDGSLSKHNNAIHITQSLKNKEILNDIENTLIDCNLRYTKCIQKRKGEESKYSDVVHFIISYGEPRAYSDRNKGLHGWNIYEKYIVGCKGWTDNFEDFNEHQFDVFIEAINNADGAHRVANDYIIASKSICCGISKTYADGLQSLAVRRGYRANLCKYINQNGNEAYILHLKKLSYSTISGCNVKEGCIRGNKPYKRARLEVESSSVNNEVWCVKTEYGTIITRRNGKIIIMGNCGRAIRPHPSKKEAWLVDLCGNIERFGEVSDLRLLQDEKGRWNVYGKGNRQLTNVIL